MISSLESLRQQRITDRRQPSHLRENDAESHDTLSVELWTQALEEFLIQLSDQQLFLGLVVLVCAFAVYFRTALGGNDNLWHAADVACFSMFSHAATVLALRTFFREHKKLAAVRVLLMITVFALWATIGHYMLHPGGPYHKAKSIVLFWRGATYIEFIGVTWAYTLTSVPIFISNEAIAVGRAISSNDNRRLGESLRIWEQKCVLSSRKWYNPVSWLRVPRFMVVRLLFSLEGDSKWKKYVLSIIFSTCFSQSGTAVILCALWLFTLSALVVGFIPNMGELGWDFGQLLSLAMVILPLQSFASAIASTF